MIFIYLDTTSLIACLYGKVERSARFFFDKMTPVTAHMYLRIFHLPN